MFILQKNFQKAILFTAAVLVWAALPLGATVPAWWSEYGVVDSGSDQTSDTVIGENYQLALLGQAKFMAYQAYLTMEAEEKGSAGSEIKALVEGFSTTTDDNYQILLLGQLKEIAKPFYDRFEQRGYDVTPWVVLNQSDSASADYYPYPWKDPQTYVGNDMDMNYQPANVGQLKYLFSFGLENWGIPSTLVLDAISDPIPGTPEIEIATGSIAISGVVTSTNFQSLSVNGVVIDSVTETSLASAVPPGSFSFNQPLPDEGLNELAVRLRDQTGNVVVETLSINRVTQAPVLTVNHPFFDPMYTNINLITVDGKVGDSTHSFEINGVDYLSALSAGNFSIDVSLSEGVNLLEFVVADVLGNTQTVTSKVILDTSPPAIDSPTASMATTTYTNSNTFSYSGKLSEAAQVFVNGVEAKLSDDGTNSFSEALPLIEGNNTITVDVIDNAGNAYSETFTIYYDTLAPDLVVISPNSGSVTNGASVSVQAECDDQSGLISVTVNGVDMSSGAQYFSATLPLEEGINDFVLVATDTAGNSTSRSVQVSRDTVAPSFVELSPADDESVTTAARTVSVTGQIDDHSGWVTINGGDPILPVNGLFTTKLALGQETNLFSVQAFDLAGNVSDAFNFTVIRQTVPGAIVLTNPPSYIQNDRVPFAGTATADSVVTVSGARNSIEAVADSSSNFATDEVIVFSDQSNYLVFTALDSLGNVSNVGHQLISDTVAPTITVLSPTEGADVNSGTVTVAGFINDANPGGTVSINGGTPVVANAEGFFTTTLDFVHGVSPTLAIQAMDEAGNVSASVDRSFSVSDAGGPAFVQILSPSYGETVPSANVDLTLIVQNRASLTEFSVNGTDHLASIVSDSVTISGVTANANNEILISYTSSSGNSSLTHLLDVDSSVPAVPVVQTLSPSGHVQSREVALFATMDPDTAYRIDGGLFSGDLIGRSDSTGQVSVVIPLVLNDVGSENVLSLTAIGANGLESQKLLPFVRHDTLAPALAEVDGILPPVGGVLTVAAPAVTLTFDSAMETPLESDFQFSQGGSVLPFSMTSSLDGSGNTQITITPTILLNGSDVLLSILGPLTDLAGNAFDGLLEYRFETIDQTAPDDPEIISYRAVTNESSVEVIGTAEAGSTVTISDGVASLATVVAGDDGSFVVNVPLATESTYNLIATASDNATQPNSSQEVPFNVERNDSAFQILSTVPVDGETNVDTAAPITVSMSRKLNPGTIDDIFLFRPNLGEIPTEVAFDGNEQVVTLTPQEPLQGGLEYTLRIPTSVRDDVGNYLQAQEEVTFTTAIGSLDAPFLYADVDETGALFVDIIGTTSPNLEVRSSSGEFVIADVNGDFSLRVALVPDAKNEFNITVTDGNIVSPASLFTAFQDSTPPTLERVISPRNPTANLVLAFDESLQDLPTIDLDNGITGVWSFADEHNQRIVFKPDADWQIGTIYNLSITAGLIDAKGNLSSQVESGSFTVNAIQSGPDLLAAPILDPLGFARTTSPFITLRGTARTGTSLFVLGGAAQASVDIPGDGTADARFSIQVPLVQDSLNELVAYVIESGGAPGLPATVSLTHLRRETGVRIISPSADLEYNSYSVMITGILDNPAEFTSVTMETDANGSSVTEDMALIGPYFAKQFILEPYDVTLQSGAITDSSGSRRLIVADVGGSLHFRFINKDGGIQDFDSSVDFADKVAEVAALKNELDSNAFWSKALSNSEKISIFNYAAMLADFTVDEGSVSVAVSGTLLDGTVKSDSVDFSVFIQPEGLDTRAPQVSFLYPDPESVDGEAEVIGVEVIETLIVVEEGVRLNSVDVNGVVAHQELGNFFLIYAMPEEPGLTTLRAEAEDYEGNLGFNEVEVFFDTEPPSDPYEVSVDLTLFSDRVITVSGKGEPGSIIVVENGLVPVQVQVPSDSVDGSWTIQVPINENTASTLEIYARDAAGNQTKSQSFPIVHDDTAPYVLSALPGDGDVGVSPNASLFIEFSEPMDPATDFQMELDLASRLRPSELLTFNALLSADGQTLEVIPHFTFDHGDTITVTLESGLPDANGLTSIAAYQYTFDTALFDTTLSGVVLDPQIQPLANIKVGILGSDIVQFTNSFGAFILDEVPLGEQVLYVDARPDAGSGIPPQGDDRVFGYLEFPVFIEENADNSLGRPVFLVDTDFSTATFIGNEPLMDVEIVSSRDDLEGISLKYSADTARFSDGAVAGDITVTRVDSAFIPDRLPDGSIPHYLVEVRPLDFTIEPSATVRLPNVYGLGAGDEVIVFYFGSGLGDYQELVLPDGSKHQIDSSGSFVEAAVLNGGGFYGYIPAEGDFDLTRAYLTGRVVGSDSVGIPGVKVSSVAGGTAVLTDLNGYYSIPLPEVRILLIETYASIANDSPGAPELIFPSGSVEVKTSGTTTMPDIVIDRFSMKGSVRYVNEAGVKIAVAGETVLKGGIVKQVSPSTAQSVSIYAYRRLAGSGADAVYDTVPFIQANANETTVFNDAFDAHFLMTAYGASDAFSSAPMRGEVVKIVAFDSSTGYYGEIDTTIPSSADGDLVVAIDLRPPQLELDVNRVFFVDSVRRRANIPHQGIVFTDDEFVEFKTSWRTADAIPLDRPEFELPAQLRVNSVDYKMDYRFGVQGGEHFRILEIREAFYPSRLEVLQRETDVGTETFTISLDGSFASETLVPMKVRSDSYGIAQSTVDLVDDPVTTSYEFNIIDFEVVETEDGLALSGRVHPDFTGLSVGGQSIAIDIDGFIDDTISGTLTTQGLEIGLSGVATTRYGAAYTPAITGIDPNRGSQGDLVTIFGEYFSPVALDNKVAFNSAPAEVVSASETQLEVLVPEEASSGDVTVTVAGRTSNGVHFDFVSIGINNGSFEHGSFRGYVIDGGGVILESLVNVDPTDRAYMALLHTLEDPVLGVTTLLTDTFEVSDLGGGGLPYFAFDFNLMGTAVLGAFEDLVSVWVFKENGDAVRVDGVFVDLDEWHALKITGYNKASGFRTAFVNLARAGVAVGDNVQIGFELRGRGVLPEYIPGMNPDDLNPTDMGKRHGTALLLDNLRLTSMHSSDLDSINQDAFSAPTYSGSVDEQVMSISSSQTLPSGSRVFVANMFSGVVKSFDVDANDTFTISVERNSFFPEVNPYDDDLYGPRRALWAVWYRTGDSSDDDEPSNSVFIPPTLVELVAE